MATEKNIETPEKLWALFLEYKTHVKGSPLLKHTFVGAVGRSDFEQREVCLSWDGFEIFVMEKGVIKYPDLSEYAEGKNESYKEYFPLCRAIKKYCRKDQIEGGMAGIYNPSITQRLNGLTEKTQNETNLNIKAKFGE